MKITTQPSIYTTQFAIQHNGIRCDEADRQLAAMTGLTAYSYGLIPFSTELTGTEDIPTDVPIVALGAVKLVDMFENGYLPDNWLVFHHDTRFDQYFYSKLLGPELLNSRQATFMALSEAMELGVLDEPLFIKPSNDLKMFGGIVVPAGESLQSMLDQMQHQPLDHGATILVAPYQDIRREFRVVVVDGVPTGFSQYRNDRGEVKAAVVNLADRDRLYFKAQELDRHYRPLDVYTIDFAEVGPNRDLKVVEYNCFNCSGLYLADRNTIYTQIAKYVDKWTHKRKQLTNQ